MWIWTSKTSGHKPFALTCILQLSIFFSSHGSTALVALGLLYKVRRSHSDTTHSMTHLGEWSDRRRDLYLTTHNTHKRLTLMPRSKSNRQSCTRATADCAVTGIGQLSIHTGCFTTCGHYCRRWFPRSLWSKKFI